MNKSGENYSYQYYNEDLFISQFIDRQQIDDENQW